MTAPYPVLTPRETPDGQMSPEVDVYDALAFARDNREAAEALLVGGGLTNGERYNCRRRWAIWTLFEETLDPIAQAARAGRAHRPPRAAGGAR